MGEAVQKAKGKVRTREQRTWILLGDPTLRLKGMHTEVALESLEDEPPGCSGCAYDRKGSLLGMVWVLGLLLIGLRKSRRRAV